MTSRCNLYPQLGTRLKTTIWDLLGLIYSENPLDTFDHSKCKTEGWAEQVNISKWRQKSSCFLKFKWSLRFHVLSYFQVVNQWETNAAQMPKQKEVKESRMSALRFCELFSHLHSIISFVITIFQKQTYIHSILCKLRCFCCSWQTEVCQRSPESHVWEQRGDKERDTAFLQTGRKQGHGRCTHLFCRKRSSEAFLAKQQKEAAYIRRLWQLRPKPSSKTLLFHSSDSRGHWFVKQLLRYASQSDEHCEALSSQLVCNWTEMCENFIQDDSSWGTFVFPDLK